MLPLVAPVLAHVPSVPIAIICDNSDGPRESIIDLATYSPFGGIV